MKPSTLKPNDHNQVHEYHHCDPQGLWFAAVMFSVVIHFFTFWLLRLLPMGRFLKWDSGIAPIPIEFISLDSKVVLPTPKAHNPVTTTTTENFNQSLNPPIASASRTFSNSADLPVTVTPEITPSSNQPQVKPTPTPTTTIIAPSQRVSEKKIGGTNKQRRRRGDAETGRIEIPTKISLTPSQPQATPTPSPTNTVISPNQPQATPTPSPTNTVISPNQPQVTPTPSPTPVPTPNPNQQSLDEDTSRETNSIGDSFDKPTPTPSSFPSPTPEMLSPSPIASPSTESPQEEFAPESQQQGGGFLVSLSDLRLSVADRDIPTQLAQPKIERQEFAAADYGFDLELNIDKDLVLEVLLIIDYRGVPIILPEEPPQVLQGTSNMNAVELMHLVQVIIERWEFEPTYMEQGTVDQAYYVKLAISPLSNFSGE
ncbi:MAG: hypothetical protein F6K58_18285 [Symploca sp. SIO2E9]|nr:hypothetical protein [Symploca sp. SIO2E9]